MVQEGFSLSSFNGQTVAKDVHLYQLVFAISLNLRWFLCTNEVEIVEHLASLFLSACKTAALPFIFNLPCSVSFCRFLCLKNKTSASVVFTTYTQKHPSIEKGPPFVQPLLNFIWFLLLAVDGYSLTFLMLFLVSFSVVTEITFLVVSFLEEN